jgi:hypothetical protein
MTTDHTPTAAVAVPLDATVGRLVPERAAVAPWRLLTRADTIQRGDQGLNDDCETWHEVVPFVCGMQYTPGFFVPIRRAMPGCMTPDTCRGRDGCSGDCKSPNLSLDQPALA